VCHERTSLRQEIGLRSRVIDEGRPFEAAFQEEASNYPPLLLPKGSGRERRGKRPRQVLAQVTFENVVLVLRFTDYVRHYELAPEAFSDLRTLRLAANSDDHSRISNSRARSRLSSPRIG
jgi:hypothetical protein